MGAAQFVTQAAGFFTNMVQTENAYNARKMQNLYEQDAAKTNQAIAEAAAKTADERGAQQQMQSRMKYGALRGEQTTALASSNVSVDQGSALDILANTAAMSDYDAKVIQNNAAREAWGYRKQAEQQAKRRNLLRQAQSYDNTAKDMEFVGSMLGVAGSAAGNAGKGK